MTFLKRLFGQKDEPVQPPMRGMVSEEQRRVEESQQLATRQRMEAEMADAKVRRDASAK